MNCQNSNVLISVLVLTYNQEKTIGRTLDSILNQKTNYNYEIIVSDDCSQDNTRSICEEYACRYSNIVLLSKTSNLGVVRNYFRSLRAAKGEFIMGCAGDDWWHNENKIQLQIDFMHSHPNCNLCYGGVVYYNTVTGEKTIKIGHEGSPSLRKLLVSNYIAAVTMCYKRNILTDTILDNIIKYDYGMEDYPILLTAAATGQICGIPDLLATYSVTPNSISNCSTIEKKEDFETKVLKVRLDYAKRYGLLDEMQKKIKDAYHLSLSMNGVRYNKKKYCKDHVIAIQEKRWSDYVKLFLCYLPGGFRLLRFLLKDLILI